MKNRILNSLIASTILGSTFLIATPVAADEYDLKIQEAQQQAVHNQQAANSLNSIISQLTSDIEDTQSALNHLNENIIKNETSLRNTLENLQISTQEMEKLLDEISVLEQNIEARSKKLEEQARKIQVSGNSSNYFEFILEAESLTDVIGRIDIVSSLITSSNSMMEDQIRDQQAVEVKKEETERKIVQQNALVEELEATSATLEVQKVSQTALIAQLALEKSSATDDRDALLSQRNEALRLVSEIENERESIRVAAVQAEKEREEQRIAEAAEAERQASEERQVAERTPEVTPASSVRESTPTVASVNSSSSSNAASSTNSSTNSSSSSNAASSTNSSTNSSSNTNTNSVSNSSSNANASSNSNNSSANGATTPPPAKEEKVVESKPTPAPSGNVVSIASQYTYVKRYTWGGNSPSTGFDCSGYTKYVFAQVGKNLPRTASGQYASSTKVSNPQPGDLVFFSGNGSSVTHVGIYVGGGQFIGSQNSTGVAYASATTGYWGARLVGYGRY